MQYTCGAGALDENMDDAAKAPDQCDRINDEFEQIGKLAKGMCRLQIKVHSIW